MTRSEYYRNLDAISKRDGMIDFINYAIQGFVDGIREQVKDIQNEQIRVTWVNYVHESFSNKTTEVAKRQRTLALLISQDNSFRPIGEILAKSMPLTRTYANLDKRTLTRDLNVLLKMGLILRSPKKHYKSNVVLITSFLPWRNDTV